MQSANSLYFLPQKKKQKSKKENNNVPSLGELFSINYGDLNSFVICKIRYHQVNPDERMKKNTKEKTKAIEQSGTVSNC